MKIPKYIDEALTKRTKYACKLDDAMNVVMISLLNSLI